MTSGDEAANRRGHYHRCMLREHPYRFAFPMGVALGAAGVAHWVGYAQGWLADYRPIFHVTAQVQGLVSCFAAGFLLTMLPRRLQAASPGLLTVLGIPLACAASAALTWAGRLAEAQVIWALAMAVLLGFAATRISGIGARRRAPNAFVWIVLALGMGVAGSLLTLVAAASGQQPLLHQFGQDLVLQGLPLALIVGVGSLALPLMTRDEPAADGFRSSGDAAVIAVHVTAAGVLVASFWVAAAWSLRAGLALRFAVVAASLALVARLWRPPTRPGWNARLIWMAAWAAAAGLAIAAVWPRAQLVGLHVTFILGVALLCLAIAAQVSFGHGGRRDEVMGKPVTVPVVGALALAAAVARAAMELQPERYRLWMGAAAVLLLAALLVWSAWVVPTWRWRRAPARDG